MKRLAFFLLLLLAASVARARDMSVASMTQASMDLSAAVYPRADLNGVACALVKVVMPEGAKFEGSIIQPVEYNTGEYWVYVTAGTKQIRVKHSAARPLQIVFADYGIPRLESKTTYTLDITMPAGTAAPAAPSAVAGRNYAVFTVEPPTATVTIDGNMHEPRNGKVRVLLRRGDYDYTVEAPGYLAEQGRVAVGAEKAELSVALRSVKGTLSVTAATPGTDIYVNGEKMGVDRWEGELLPGEYKVEGRRAGYTSVVQASIVATGQTTQIALPVLHNTKGFMTVTAATAGTDIYVNGEKVGTDNYKGEYVPGEYLVEGRRESHLAVEQLATVAMGEQCFVALPMLTPITGSLNVDYEPDGAVITIDGHVRGTVPAVFDNLLIGKHSITISSSGYVPQTHNISINESELAILSGQLSKQQVAAPFSLCTIARDGSIVYFTADEWQQIPSSQRYLYTKLGVVLADGSEAFLVELNDRGILPWKDALKNNLPTIEQCKIIYNNSEALNSALKVFGGKIMEGDYWTKTGYDANAAWSFTVTYKNSILIRQFRNRQVRAVAPLPVDR